MLASPSPLTFLRAVVPHDPTSVPLREALREALLETAFVLPCDMARAEREEIWNLVATSIDLPVQISARAEGLLPNHLCFVAEPVTSDPVAPSGSAVFAVRAETSGRRRLDSARALRVLRDAVLRTMGVHGRGARTGEIATWAEQATDSPATALRFAAAAHAAIASRPRASDGEVVAEAIAAVIGWMLWNVGDRAAEWVLARALPAKAPERLVSTQAAVLGEPAALQQALAAGLVEHLPEDGDEMLDLRSPLSLLRRLGDLSVTVSLEQIAQHLKPAIAPRVYQVIDRWQKVRPKPLRLEPPLRKRDFLGRDDVMARLLALLEPAHEVRTAVLYGMSGLGKSAIGAALCERLADRMEAVWLTFLDGAEPAWRRVADALGIEPHRMNEERRAGLIPGWLAHVHARMAERDALIVIDDVTGVLESDLPEWLPRGPGRCVVLVLSPRAERSLQRQNDAIAVPLRPLMEEEAKLLLVGKVPVLEEVVERGDLDRLLSRLGGHPSAIGWAAALLQKRTIPEVTDLVEHGPDALKKLAKHASGALDEEETRVVEALSVAAPTGSPRSLVAKMIGEGEMTPVLQRLADRAVVELGPRTVRMQGVVTLAVETEMEVRRRRELEERHARAVDAVMEAARTGVSGDEETRDEAYEDAMLALTRMIERCNAKEESVAELASHLAYELLEYPNGAKTEKVNLAIRACEAALAFYTVESSSEQWANLQNRLGNSLQRLPIGDWAENLQRAVAAYEAALTVYTKEAYPKKWAMVQNNLGSALSKPAPRRAPDSLEGAVAAYEAALTVYTKEAHPTDWAMVQNNLGDVLRQRLAGDRAENRRRAVEAFERALTVYTKEAYPKSWARVQNNLALTLVYAGDGDRARDVDRAIDAFERGLEMHPREALPEDWAHIQFNLGIAWMLRPGGDRAANVRRAIGAIEASLTVYSRDGFPPEWARGQHSLGLALSELETGRRRDNLQAATEAFRAALTVYTREAFPADNANVRVDLEKAVAALASLGPATEPPPDITESAPPPG